MQISLRSQLLAGVAAVGATAIAITPITQPDLLPSLQRVSASVELSASIINPINAIGGVIEDINTDIFNQGLNTITFWPDFMFGLDDDYYGPLYNGLIPDLTNLFSTGALSAFVNNISGYAWAGIRGLGVIGSGTAAALFNTPFALVDAVGALIESGPEAALAILATEILGPLQLGINGAVEAVGYILDNVIANVQTLVTFTLPYLVAELLDTTTQGLGLIAGTVANTIGSAFTALTSFDLAGVWNAVVGGLLSREGVLGQIESLTIGNGILTEDGDEVTIASYRTVITSELQRFGSGNFDDGGILNAPFDPPPAPPPGAAEQGELAAVSAADPEASPISAADIATSPAVVADDDPVVATASDARAAASGTAESVTGEADDAAAQTSSGDGGAAADSTAAQESVTATTDEAATADTSASVEKPAKQRASRKAVKAAAGD